MPNSLGRNSLGRESISRRPSSSDKRTQRGSLEIPTENQDSRDSSPRSESPTLDDHLYRHSKPLVKTFSELEHKHFKKDPSKFQFKDEHGQRYSDSKSPRNSFEHERRHSKTTNPYPEDSHQFRHSLEREEPKRLRQSISKPSKASMEHERRHSTSKTTNPYPADSHQYRHSLGTQEPKRLRQSLSKPSKASMEHERRHSTSKTTNPYPADSHQYRHSLSTQEPKPSTSRSIKWGNSPQSPRRRSSSRKKPKRNKDENEDATPTSKDDDTDMENSDGTDIPKRVDSTEVVEGNGLSLASENPANNDDEVMDKHVNDIIDDIDGTPVDRPILQAIQEEQKTVSGNDSSSVQFRHSSILQQSCASLGHIKPMGGMSMDSMLLDIEPCISMCQEDNNPEIGPDYLEVWMPPALDLDPQISVPEGKNDCITCPRCYQEYDEDPRILPCLHVVCERCLKYLIETASTEKTVTKTEKGKTVLTETGFGTFLCPQCKGEVPFSPSKEKSFHVAHFINMLKEYMERMKPNVNGYCDHYNKIDENSRYYCYHCKLCCCESCICCHKAKNHRVEPAEELHHFLLKGLLWADYRCQIHSNEETNKILYFCQKCDLTGCEECMEACGHRKDAVLLSQTSRLQQRMINHYINGGVRKAFTHLSKLVVRYNKYYASLQTSYTRVNDFITAQTQKARAFVEEMKEMLYSDVDAHMEIIQEEDMECIRFLMALAYNLKILHAFLESAMLLATDEDFPWLYDRSSEVAEAYFQSIKAPCLGHRKIEILGKGCQEVSLGLTVKKRKYMYQCKVMQNPINLLACSKDMILAVYHPPMNLFKPSVIKPISMNKAHADSLLSMLGDFCQSCCSLEFVNFHGKEYLAVVSVRTLLHFLDLFSEKHGRKLCSKKMIDSEDIWYEKLYKHSVIYDGDDKYILRNPYAVCDVPNQKGIVYVEMAYGPSLQMKIWYDEGNLETDKLLFETGLNTHPFIYNPQYICCTSDHHIFVIDAVACRILIIDFSGKVLSQIVDDSQSDLGPHGVVGYLHWVFIAFQERNTISRYTTSGEFVDDYITGWDGLKGPISLNIHGEVLLCGQQDGCISYFDLSELTPVSKSSTESAAV